MNDNGKQGKMTVNYKDTHIRLLANFSVETVQIWREWNGILKILKDNNSQSKIIYPEN